MRHRRRIGVITGEVGADKTVAIHAALAALDPTRHIIIYLPHPTVGVRGIHHQTVAALGGQPLVHHATLVPQTADALAVEQAERGRTPVLVIDEAHLPCTTPPTRVDPDADLMPSATWTRPAPSPAYSSGKPPR